MGFPAVHLGMVVPREALEKLKAAETAAWRPPDGGADGRRDSGGVRAFRRRDTSVLAAAVTTDALYIRRSGDWDAEALALVGYGTTVAVTGKSGGWYQVRYDGIEGYLRGISGPANLRPDRLRTGDGGCTESALRGRYRL